MRVWGNKFCFINSEIYKSRKNLAEDWSKFMKHSLWGCKSLLWLNKKLMIYIYVYIVYILFKDIYLISRESQYLVGFVLRRDIQLAIENARSRLDALPGSTLCVFTQHLPVVGSGPPPIKMRKIVDLAPITITDQVIRWLICRSK